MVREPGTAPASGSRRVGMTTAAATATPLRWTLVLSFAEPASMTQCGEPSELCGAFATIRRCLEIAPPTG